jgi:hypothetical protein
MKLETSKELRCMQEDIDRAYFLLKGFGSLGEYNVGEERSSCPGDYT